MQLVRVLQRVGIVARRRQQVRGGAFACLEDRLRGLRNEIGQIERIGFEADDRNVTLVLGTALDRSVPHYEQRPASGLQDLARVGLIGEGRIRIPRVVQQQSVKRSVAGPVPDVEGQAVFHGDETTGLDDVGHKIRSHPGDFAAQFRQTER